MCARECVYMCVHLSALMLLNSYFAIEITSLSKCRPVSGGSDNDCCGGGGGSDGNFHNVVYVANRRSLLLNANAQTIAR